MAQTAVATNTKPLSDTAKKYEGKYDALLKEHGNVSKVIRFLAAQGCTKGEIAKITGKRYQHVRNVLITPVGKQTSSSTAPATATATKK